MRHLGLALFASLAFTSTAEAKPGGIGLGLVGEDPSGLTLGLAMGSSQYLDFRLGFGIFDGVFVGQGNYIISPFTITQGGGFTLPFYIGLGGEVQAAGNFLGVQARVPIGLSLDLTAVPVDIFLEIAPGLQIIPDVNIDIDGAIGVRYWF